jgi:hypothetical protein
LRVFTTQQVNTTAQHDLDQLAIQRLGGAPQARQVTVSSISPFSRATMRGWLTPS